MEILLAHPGGPFWAKKTEHAWSVPKGEFVPGEETAADAARREVEEELGVRIEGELTPLPSFRAGKKRLHVFAHELDATGGDIEVALQQIRADDRHRSMVEIEWPPRSGRTQTFPEVDRVAWVALDEADTWLHKGQRPVVEHLRSVVQPG